MGRKRPNKKKIKRGKNDFIFSITTQDARKHIPFHKGLHVKYTQITV